MLERIVVNRCEPDPDLRRLKLAKANRGKAKTEFTLRWTPQGFIRDEKAEAGLDAVVRKATAEATFLDLLRKLCREGRRLGFNSTRSPIYAPRVLADHGGNSEHKFTETEFRRAMDAFRLPSGQGCMGKGGFQGEGVCLPG